MWEMPSWIMLVRELQERGYSVLEAVIVANNSYKDDGTRTDGETVAVV
jgi:hypothetical protein